MDIVSRGRSIKYRLTLGYVVSMCISIAVAIFLILTVMKGYTEANLYKNDLSNIKLFYSYLENQIENVKLVANNIVISNLVQDRLNENDINKDYALELNRIVSDYQAIRSIYIVSKDMKIDDFNDRAWYQTFESNFINSIDFNELEELRGKIKCEIKSNKYINDDENSIVLSRAIIGKDNLESIGYLFIDIDSEYLNEIYHSFVEDANIEYLLSDKDNNSILLSSNKETEGIEDSLIGFKSNSNSYIKLKYNNNSYNLIYKNADVLNGKMIAIIKPVSYISELKWMFAIILIVSIFFALIYFNLVKKLVLRPIHEITDSIEGIMEKSNLDAKFDVEMENYEINKINIALNRMMDKIGILVDEVKQEHTKQRKFELDLLTNHVKPHFLFNVLNVARALITLRKYDDSKRLLNITAQYYRSWLNKGNDVITIEEELDILKYYIEIMRIRDAEEFTISYDIDEDLLNMKIPKLILQPLVENSFKHAIKDTYEPLNIKIEVKKLDSNKVEVIVSDDGNGISKETIDKIYNGYDLNVESGFGMRSILERLCLYYGTSNPRDIIKIESEVNEYTNIIITLDEKHLKSFI